jgi:hypothetical protein
MYFFGSDCSSASTPASNGSSSNGLSFGVASGPPFGASSPKPASGAGSVGGVLGAGLSPASFKTNFLSSFTLLCRFFFLIFLQ